MSVSGFGPRRRRRTLTASLPLLLAVGVQRLQLAAAVPDDAVLASQSYYTKNWGKLYQQGDAAGCAEAYSASAVLKLSFQPNLEPLTAATGWKDGQVVRGREALQDFWQAAVKSLGTDYVGDEDEGDFVARRLVMDQDTVITSGKVKLGSATARRLAQTWQRAGQEWKITSELLELEDYRSPETQTQKEASAVDAGKIVEDVLKTAESDKGGDVAKEVLSIGKGVAGELGKDVKDISKEASSGSDKSESLEASEEPPKSSGSGSFWLLSLIVLFGGGGAFFLFRRQQKKREATISGFEAMLG